MSFCQSNYNNPKTIIIKLKILKILKYHFYIEGNHLQKNSNFAKTVLASEIHKIFNYASKNHKKCHRNYKGVHNLA